MFEITVKVEAPSLVGALKELAAAISGAPQPAAPAPLQPPLPTAAQPLLPAAQTMPVQQQIPQFAAPPAVPVAQAAAYTHEQLMRAGAALVDAGKMNELTALLGAFGVQAVTQLKTEQFGAFAAELRKQGANI